jgi:hypothetical protein
MDIEELPKVGLVRRHCGQVGLGEEVEELIRACTLAQRQIMAFSTPFQVTPALPGRTDPVTLATTVAGSEVKTLIRAMQTMLQICDTSAQVQALEELVDITVESAAAEDSDQDSDQDRDDEDTAPAAPTHTVRVRLQDFTPLQKFLVMTTVVNTTQDLSWEAVEWCVRHGGNPYICMSSGVGATGAAYRLATDSDVLTCLSLCAPDALYCGYLLLVVQDTETLVAMMDVASRWRNGLTAWDMWHVWTTLFSPAARAATGPSLQAVAQAQGYTFVMHSATVGTMLPTLNRRLCGTVSTPEEMAEWSGALNKSYVRPSASEVARLEEDSSQVDELMRILGEAPAPSTLEFHMRWAALQDDLPLAALATAYLQRTIRDEVATNIPICFMLASQGANIALLLEDRVLFPEQFQNAPLVQEPGFTQETMQCHAAVLRTMLRAAPPPPKFVADQLTTTGGCYLKLRALVEGTSGSLSSVLQQTMPNLIDQVGAWVLHAAARDRGLMLAETYDFEGNVRWTLSEIVGPIPLRPLPAQNMQAFLEVAMSTLACPLARGQALGYVPPQAAPEPVPFPLTFEPLGLPPLPEAYTVRKSEVTAGFFCPVEEYMLLYVPHYSGITHAELWQHMRSHCPPGVLLCMLMHVKEGSVDLMDKIVNTVPFEDLLGAIVLAKNTFPPDKMMEFAIKYRLRILARAALSVADLAAITWPLNSAAPQVHRLTMAAAGAEPVPNTCQIGPAPWFAKELTDGVIINMYNPGYDDFSNLRSD